MIKPSISRISESAITLSWEPKISSDIHAMVIALDKSISSFPFLGWIENVPAYYTLTVYFDPIAFWKFQNWEEIFSEYIDELLISSISIIKSEQKVFEIPVKYHPSVAPDLLLASEILQIDIPTIIDLHTSTIYTVFLIGFMPGFPYLGILPEQLELPRKSTPAMQVPAGTVAIAGKQTGIYPHQSPGGWYGIGHTDIKMFCNGKSLLQAGDRVKFVAI
jgi:inhibitor of KinA